MNTKKTDPVDSTGYKLVAIACVLEDPDYGVARITNDVRLLLPIFSAEKLAADHLELCRAMQAALNQETADEATAEAKSNSGTAVTGPSAAIVSRNRQVKPNSPELSLDEKRELNAKENAKRDLEVRKKSLRDRHTKDKRKLARTHVEVYEWSEPLVLLDQGKLTADRDHVSRAKVLFNELEERGNFRIIAAPKLVPKTHQALIEAHPNFKDVIDFAMGQIALAQKSKKNLTIPPILLLGEPGVGKTHFSLNLAKALGTMVHRISFDSAQSSSSLLGSDRNWGNTHMGQVTEAILCGTHANPVILLDELDKARINGGYQDPRASLHSLLEPVSSNSIKDISVELRFDASHIIWIATANQPSEIPATLRSRFTEFEVKAPTGEQALRMAEVIAKATHLSMDLHDFNPPESALTKLLAHLTPREQRQALERAYATAIANNRKSILRSDLPAEVLIDDLSLPSGQTPGWLH